MDERPDVAGTIGAMAHHADARDNDQTSRVDTRVRELPRSGQKRTLSSLVRTGTTSKRFATNPRPNTPIEGKSTSGLRPLAAAPHVKR
jgi:hypothetical protein